MGRQTLLSAGVWESCEVDELPAAEGPCVWGIDLGSGHAMSAVSSYWPATGRLECLAAFPDNPSLASRGAADHVGGVYQRMLERRELIVTPGRVVVVSDLLRAAMERFGSPDLVVADRWREGELRDGLDLAGVPASAFSPRGMGWKDGSSDVRGFRRACIEGRVRVHPSLLIRAALSEALTVSDPAGNQKLAKSSEGGRRQAAKDDAAAACILAIAAGERSRAHSEGPSTGPLVVGVV